MDIKEFPPGVIEHLGWYVYRLIDPRYGNTFYVGKEKIIVFLRICAERWPLLMTMSY
jgi:hypothetical protein